MWAIVAFCLSLPPILFLGALFIELLLWDAPRRGKRPDVQSRDTSLSRAGRRVRVVTNTGLTLSGTPLEVVRHLAKNGFDGAPMRLSAERALQLLNVWSETGRLRVHGEW